MMAVPPVHHACNHPTYNHHRPNILVYSWWWRWRLWWTTTHATIQPIIIIGLIFFSFLRSLFRRLHLVDVGLHKNIAKSITKPGSTLMNFDGTGTSVFSGNFKFDIFWNTSVFVQIFEQEVWRTCLPFEIWNKIYEEEKTIASMIMII